MEMEEEQPGGAPGWVVTYGDTMSLMLTFFILLASMSEVKKQEQCKAVVESLQKRFGRDSSTPPLIPGTAASRDSSALAAWAACGRSRRLDTIRSGTDICGPVGEHGRLQQPPPSSGYTQIGTLSFDEGSGQLSEDSRQRLQAIARNIQGRPQKIEIRGSASILQDGLESPYRDQWDLAYARCHNAAEFLVKLGVDRKRITIGVAADSEPGEPSMEPQRTRGDLRVGVFMLSELVVGSGPTSKPKPELPLADARKSGLF